MWTDYLQNNRSIKAIYDFEPSLQNIEVHELSFKRDGSSIYVRLDLNELPKTLPKKWQIGKFNTVQLTFDFFEVSEISMNGWGNKIKATISLESDEKGLHVNINGDFSLKFIADGVDLNYISAYCDSLKEDSEQPEA